MIRKQTGQTASEYIQNKLIERAKEALLGTDKTTSEIAYGLDIFQHLGFRNLTRGETDYRTVLIVVTLTSIRDIPAVGIFQIKSVRL